MIKIPITLFAVVLFTQCDSNKNKPTYKAYAGSVADKETAIQIAEAVWVPIYGKAIYDEKPFVAQLNADSVWIVQGTLAEGSAGGVAYIALQKSDGKVLKVTHGK